ncbi:glycine cleavage system protein T, partial [Georgenia sp. 10Sc9-8]|nr:glycine cleavage system protein T [Georgenia halotolerans]
MPSSSPHQEHPQRTALHAVHVDAGAVMTDFAGWAMPLRYTSQIEEHHAVRRRAGLFDLSHMAQIEVSGPAAGRALDHALVSRCSGIRVGRARYTMMVAEDGGVLDDLIVYRVAPEGFLVVANAANRDVVREELTVRSGTGGPDDDVAVEDRTEHRALLALQGPRSADVLSRLTDADLGALRYYAIVSTAVAG